MISTFSKIDSPPTQDHLSFCSQLIDCLRVPPEEQQSQLALDKYKLLSIGLGKSPKQALLQLKSDSLPYEFSCSNVLMHGDKAYRCNDCCRDPSSCLCIHCFEPEKHQGHNYHILTVNGGTCDCGRDNAWDPAGMCTKHQQNRAIGDPLTSIRQESTKQKLQDFTHALCDTVTSLIITQYFQLSKLWDGFRLEVALGKSLEKTVASGQDKPIPTLAIEWILKELNSLCVHPDDPQVLFDRSSTNLDSFLAMNQLPPIDDPQKGESGFFPVPSDNGTIPFPEYFIDLTEQDKLCNSFHVSESFLDYLAAIPNVTAVELKTRLRECLTQLSKFLTQRHSLIECVVDALHIMSEDAGGGVRRLITISLNRSRPVLFHPSPIHSVPKINPVFVALVSDSVVEELMGDFPHPDDVHQMLQMDLNNPDLHLAPNAHHRFWLRHNRLFIKSDLFTFLINLSFDNAFLYSYARTLHENYSVLLTNKYIPSSEMGEELDAFISNRFLDSFGNFSCQLSQPVLIQADVDFSFVFRKKTETMSGFLSQFTSSSTETYLHHLLTQQRHKKEYLLGKDKLQAIADNVGASIRRLNAIQKSVNLHTAVQASFPLPTPNISKVQLCHTTHKRLVSEIWSEFERISHGLEDNLITHGIVQRFLSAYSSDEEALKVSSKLLASLRKESIGSLPSMNGDLPLSPVLDAYLVFSTLSSSNPAIRVVSPQPYNDITVPFAPTIYSSHLSNFTLKLIYSLTSSQDSFRLIRFLAHLATSRMLASSPHSILFPYKPHLASSPNITESASADSECLFPDLRVHFTEADLPSPILELVRACPPELLQEQEEKGTFVENVDTLVFDNLDSIIPAMDTSPALRRFLLNLVLRRMVFAPAFTDDLNIARSLSIICATHLTLIPPTTPISSFLSADEALLLCEEPLQIHCIVAQTVNGIWNRNDDSIRQRLNFYLHRYRTFNNGIPDMHLIQLCICAAGWDRFLSLFLTLAQMDFFFLPAWFWTKMSEIQDRSSTNDGATEKIVPSNVERVGNGWAMEPTQMVGYVSMVLSVLLVSTTFRGFELCENEQTIKKRKGIATTSDDTVVGLAEHGAQQLLLPLSDTAITQQLITTLGPQPLSFGELDEELGPIVGRQPSLEAHLKKHTAISKGLKPTLKLKPESVSMVDVYNLNQLPQISERYNMFACETLVNTPYEKYSPHNNICEDLEDFLTNEQTTIAPRPEDLSVSPGHAGIPHPFPTKHHFNALTDIATSRTFLGMVWSVLHITVHEHFCLDSSTLNQQQNAVPSSLDVNSVAPLNFQKLSIDRIVIIILRLLDQTVCSSKQWVIEREEKKQPQLSTFSDHPLALPCTPDSSFIEALFLPIDCGCLSTVEEGTAHQQSIASLLFRLYSHVLAEPNSLSSLITPLLSRLLIRLRFLVNVFFRSDPRITQWHSQIGLSETIQQSPSSADAQEQKKKQLRERQKRIMEQMKKQQSAFADQIDDDDDEQHGHGVECTTGLTCIACHGPIMKGESAGYVAHCDYSTVLQTLNTSAIKKQQLRSLIRRVKALGTTSDSERSVKRWWNQELEMSESEPHHRPTSDPPPETDEASSVEDDGWSEDDLTDLQLQIAVLMNTIQNPGPDQTDEEIEQLTQTLRQLMDIAFTQQQTVRRETGSLALIKDTSTARHFLGEFTIPEPGDSLQKLDEREIRQNTSEQCTSLFEEIGWRHAGSAPVAHRVPVFQSIEGALRFGLPMNRISFNTLQAARKQGNVDWLDEHLLVEGSECEMWGDCLTQPTVKMLHPFHPHSPNDVTSYTVTQADQSIPCNASDPVQLKRHFFVQSCGHVIHSSCYAKVIRQQRADTLELPLAGTISCPACRQNANCLVPLLGAEITECTDGKVAFEQIVSNESTEGEEERVDSILKQGTIPRRDNISSSVVPLNASCLDDTTSPQADLFFSLTTDLTITCTAFYRQMDLLMKRLISPVNVQGEFVYSHTLDKIEGNVREILRGMKLSTIFPQLNTEKLENPDNIKLSKVELFLSNPTVFEYIIGRAGTVVDAGAHRNLTPLLQNSRFAHHVLHHATGLELGASDKIFSTPATTVPSFENCANLSALISSLVSVRENLVAHPDVSPSEKKDIIHLLHRAVTAAPITVPPNDSLLNPILTALCDTLASHEWSTRPMVLPGVNIFEELVLTEQAVFEKAKLENKENSLSFYASRNTPPLNTEAFAVSQPEQTIIAALFRAAYYLSFVTVSTAENSHNNLLSTIVGEVNTMKIVTLSTQILSVLVQGGLQDQASVSPSSQEISTLLGNGLDTEDQAVVKLILDTLTNFTGSDLLPLFVQLLSLVSLVQSDHGISHLPVTPSLFTRVLYDVLDSIPRSSSITPSSSVGAISDWFNPINGDFAVHTFLRRASLLFFSLFPAHPQTVAFEKILSKPLFDSENGELLSFETLTQTHHQAYQRSVNEIDIFYIPTVDDFQAFFSRFTSHPLVTPINTQHSPSLIPDALLLPSLVSFPLAHHDALRFANNSVCLHCRDEPHTASTIRRTVCMMCGKVICLSLPCCRRKLELTVDNTDDETNLFALDNFVELNQQIVSEEIEHAAVCPGPILPLIGTFPISIHLEPILGFIPYLLPGVYVDSHGEPDIGNNRGQPLTFQLIQYGRILSYICKHQSVHS